MGVGIIKGSRFRSLHSYNRSDMTGVEYFDVGRYIHVRLFLFVNKDRQRRNVIGIHGTIAAVERSK